jgi:probable HAF family extracellular repeat protein
MKLAISGRLSTRTGSRPKTASNPTEREAGSSAQGNGSSEEVNMKRPIALSVLCAVLLVGAGHGEATTSQRTDTVARYDVAELSTLGGASTAGFSINNRGWVAGRSNLPDNQIRHATLWRNDVLTDLGTLGDPEKRNSVVRWPVKNTGGLITGISQTDEPDPNNENWSCSAFFPPATGTGYQCVGFKWQNGVMTPLPTLGGTHGFAAGANNAGRIVGWAENTVHDPNCEPPQVLQFHPVAWGPNDRIRALPLLPGDSSGAATAINDRGQIIGISGICDQAIGRFTARRAVLWDDGDVIDIGNLGGVAWHTPNAINLHGDIVGFSNFSAADGGEYHPHAFLWTEDGGIRDLLTLPAPFNDNSDAWGINYWGQAVGRSCDVDGNCHAFLWQNGAMTDLNCLVDPGDCDPGDTLIAAFDINDRGIITGQAFDDEEGKFVAFVATPTRG